MTTVITSGDAGPAVECSPPLRTGAAPRSARGDASGKEDYLRRRKIEGQVRGLQKMIEADTWCPDVVTQVTSATRAVQEVAVGLLNDHSTTASATPPAEGDQVLDEVTGTIRQVILL